MSRQSAVVVGVVGGILIGWFVGSSLTTASAQTEPAPQVVQCHYEIYGPSGPSTATVGYTATGWMERAGGPISEPVILLNQCTGDSWQYRWNDDAQVAPQWQAIRVPR